MKLIRDLVRDALAVGDTAIERWLDAHVSEKVQRNVKIVTPETAGARVMLHISTDNAITEFIPYISPRQAPSEDRTCPRVVCAPSVFGCLIGYHQSLIDHYASTRGKKQGPPKWQGGYTIYGLYFGQALQPNTQLVYDADRSGETWLVPYDRQSGSYVPDKLGKLFFRHVEYANDDEGVVDAYVEVNHLDGIAFSQNVHLKKGFWRVEFPYRQSRQNDWRCDQDFCIQELDRADYQAVKSERAALLSYQEKTPAFLSW